MTAGEADRRTRRRFGWSIEFCPFAVGGKNWLFVGSPRKGREATKFFAILESCRRSSHNTFEYVSDILVRIGQHPVNQLDQLLPDRWQPAPRTA